jgi:hypothetical protein
MSRLFRSIFVVASVLLCLAVSASWVRSYWVSDVLIWGDGNGSDGDRSKPEDRYTKSIVISRGGVMCQARYEVWGIMSGWLFGGPFHSLEHVPPTSYPFYRPAYASSPPNINRYAGMGFEIVTPAPSQQFGYAEDTKSVTTPLYAQVLLTAILPGLSLRSWRRRRLCVSCGYDMRASEGKCPECGMVVPSDRTGHRLDSNHPR